MPYKEVKIEKLYYTITEVADQLNVSPSLIRYWESEFDLIKSKRSKKGNRQFYKNDIDNLKMIYHLVKEKGFTIKGARKYLNNNKEKTLENTQMIDKLNEIKKFLQKLKKNL